MAKTSTVKKATSEPLGPEMVTCQSPTGRTTQIPKWKYDLVRRAIVNVLPSDEIGIMFRQLAPMVNCCITRDERRGLGSINYLTTTVKLDMEARGEIIRFEGMRPQYVRLAPGVE